MDESAEKSLEYYSTNIVNTMVSIRTSLDHGVEKFVFNSSDIVYGDDKPPFVETINLTEDHVATLGKSSIGSISIIWARTVSKAERKFD